MGTALLAPDAATVVFAGPDQAPDIYGPYENFYGNTLVFRLDRAWRDQPVYVLYGHLGRIDVAVGDRVERGQPVGAVGMTGIAIGPHLHVEVRLGGSDYNSVYNPALWLEPLPGTGAVAGQVVTSDGRAWHGVHVLLYRLDANGRSLYRVLHTYAADPGLHPDPDLAENFALGDIPAGDYELVVGRGGRVYRQSTRVEPGQTAYVQLVIDG